MKARILVLTAVLSVLLPVTTRSAITGQWDFNGGDLSATVGTPLSYLDSATQAGTEFGTTTSFGIANIGGQPATIMKFPKMASASMGYSLTHNIAPNGSGLNVNHYTLILDVLYPTASSGKYRSITQTDNSGDGDFFLNPGNGIGISGSYPGNVTPDVWHRIILAVDLAAMPHATVSKYIDGVKVGTQDLDSLDGRWSLRPTMNFLNDEDGESEIGYINSLQIRDVKISDGLATLLGAPTASGIPSTDLTPHPYVESTTPANNDSGVAATTVISAQIVDGEHQVTSGSEQLFLNGSLVPANVSKNGGTTTVSYQAPSPLPDGSTNTAKLVYADGTGSFTNTWTFFIKPLSQPPSITGQWDFENGDLAATIGAPLEYFDGTGGTAQSQTQFGTTTSFGIPDIAGVPAKVMRFPGASTPQLAYVMRHGAVPNGDGHKVNQWTLIMDTFLPHENNEEWFSFLQINDLGNTGDGDLFANFSGDTAGIGIGGNYGGSTAISAHTWHRVAFAVTLSTSGGTISKFIDGVKHSDQSLSGNQLDGRWALSPYALLFGDEDGESQPAYINSVQVRSYKMRDSEIAALGAATSGGIPTVSGQWDFDAGDLSATIGSAMVPRNNDLFYTSFETAVIDGQDAQVMGFAGITPLDGYLMPHGALPNGGGQNVNQYSILMDIMFPSSSTGYRNLWQTETNNSSDGDLFINPDDAIGISGQYQGNLTPDVWHRVALTFDLTKRELGKFIDGSNVLTGPVGSPPLGSGRYQYLSGGADGRFSLGPAALVFSDDDGEIAPGYVNSIQFRVGVLTPQQIAILGGATGSGIPVNVPAPPHLTIQVDFDTLLISWPPSYSGYILEGAETLGADTSWAPIPDVLNNSVSVYTTGEKKFFRLRKM